MLWKYVNLINFFYRQKTNKSFFFHFQFYKDQDLRNSFEQMQTYKVMLSLLYKNKRYADIFDLYKDIRKRLDLYELFPDITVNCLAFAACYHLVSEVN